MLKVILLKYLKCFLLYYALQEKSQMSSFPQLFRSRSFRQIPDVHNQIIAAVSFAGKTIIRIRAEGFTGDASHIRNQ